MSFNSFGHLFRFTTWGESHGPAIGVVVDGCPPRIPLTEQDIQPYLDKRRPGTSRHVTPRQESDAVQILSGIFADDRFDGQQVTTGTPISMIIHNKDQRSKDYGDIARQYRPGHADFTYDAKYGVRDYRGGGRSSARETACRVAAGAIARKVIGASVKIRACVVGIGEHQIGDTELDWAFVQDNPLNCPSKDHFSLWEDYLDDVRKRQTSVGARIRVEAIGVPPGLGAPVYAKLDTELAAALMSINAVKAVSIGDTSEDQILLEGHEVLDAIRSKDERMSDGSNEWQPEFASNFAGGILGGISTGQPIVAHFNVKPTSSISRPRPSVDRDGKNVELVTKGRHDPCVGIRAVSIAEAMTALVLADHLLMHRAQCG